MASWIENAKKFAPEEYGNFQDSIGSIGKNAMGIAGSMIAAKKNVNPIASSSPYLAGAKEAFGTTYGAFGSMDDVLNNYSNTARTTNISGTDLYNPTKKERFGQLFSVGMAGYQSGKGMMDGIFGAIGNAKGVNAKIDEGLNKGVDNIDFSDNKTSTTPKLSDWFSNDSNGTPQFNLHKALGDSPNNDLFSGLILNTPYPNTSSTKQVSTNFIDYQNPQSYNPYNMKKYTNPRPMTGTQGVLNNNAFDFSQALNPSYATNPDILAKPFNNTYAGGGFIDAWNAGGWKGAASTGVGLLVGGANLFINHAAHKRQVREAQAEAERVNELNKQANIYQQHNLDQFAMNSKNNMFNRQALQMMAEGGDLYGVPDYMGDVMAMIRSKQMAQGGDLHTHGGIFPMNGNLDFIENGGTHEENPLGGVPQGADAQGVPNLVEEGEAVWDGYVFSDRLKIPDDVAYSYGIKKDSTFSKAVERVSKESEERPNDPISQRGLEDALETLRVVQEDVRMKEQMRELQKAIGNMSEEELQQFMQAIQSPESGMPQGMPQEQMAMPQEEAYAGPTEEEVPMEEEGMQEEEQYGLGGNLFAKGGLFANYFSGNGDKSQQMQQGGSWNTDWEALFATALNATNKNNLLWDTGYKYNIHDLEDSQRYKNWTDYVLQNGDTDESIKDYLKRLSNISKGEGEEDYLFDENGKLRDDWKNRFKKARTDQKYGYFHYTPEWIYGVKSEANATGTTPTDTATGDKTDTTTAKKAKTYQTFTRYAPVVGNAIGLWKTLAERPKDYSTIASFRTPSISPVGTKVGYTPIDTQRYINTANQGYNAQLNAIMNATTGNSNMAMAQASLLNNQRNENVGKIMSTAEAMNEAKRMQVAQFNRGTDQINSGLQNSLNGIYLHQDLAKQREAQLNAQTRFKQDQLRDAAISENLTTLFDNLGLIGKENWYMNNANNRQDLLYGVGRNGSINYQNVLDQIPKEVINEYAKKIKG